MIPPGAVLSKRAQLVRWGVAATLIVAYELIFPVSFGFMGPATFLLALVPCVVAAALLGVRGALVAIVATILLDRSHAIALGLGPGLGLVSSIALKLACGLGVGLFSDNSRGLKRVNALLAHEVAERKEAERRVERSERLYRALTESLGEGVGVFDPDDRFLFANRALATTLGTTPTQLIGRHVSELFAEESVARLRREGGAGIEPRSYELELLGDDPKLLLATETALEGTAAAEACTLRVIRDITERAMNERRQRELERQIERSQALQGLAVLAGGVAHDFNNLLGGVVGNAELALRRLGDSAPGELRGCLEEIKTFGREASQLGRQMLAYAGRGTLAMRAVDVNGEVEEALRLLRSTVGSQAHLEVRLEEGLPDIAADRAQLRQVITNLVLNAVEAMNDGRGNVAVFTRHRTLNASHLAAHNAPSGAMEGAYVCVTVEDDGCGMPPDIRGQIFQPFFSTKSTGRGLGLAAAAGIARSHRGWLDVRSAPGRGTRFDFWLPVPRESVQAGAAVLARDQVASGACSVLLVDDEPAVRLVTRRLLVELGCDVLTAQGGQQALQVFREHRASIDLIILDLTMPEMSGAEVLTRLRAIDDGVRVVITSGFHPSGAGDLLGAPNVVGFLDKPHTLADLEALLGVRDAASSVVPKPISILRLKGNAEDETPAEARGS